MNFTAGLLLIFLNIFLPGLIFLRFYFVGEFSKQFNTRVPVARLAFYSLIPGLILLIGMIWIYSVCGTNFTASNALQIYIDLLTSEGELQEETTNFLNNDLKRFIYFNLWNYSLAAFLGIGFHYLIRKSGVDKKLKLLRFKNPWYYIFSGEILKFKKFLNAVSDLDINELEEDTNVLTTYADVLVEQSGESRMYTGYVVDYELDTENSNQLDKIYLLDAHKYKYLDGDKKTFKKKKIPGHLFVIDYTQVQNLNLTYVPSLVRKEKKKTRKEKRRRAIVRTINFLVAGIIILFLTSFLFNFPNFGPATNELYVLPWLQKFFLFGAIVMGVGNYILWFGSEKARTEFLQYHSSLIETLLPKIKLKWIYFITMLVYLILFFVYSFIAN